MNNEFFYIVYFSPLFLFINIGVIAVLVGNSHFLKTNFSVDKLRLILRKSKKSLITYFILMIFFPTILIPLYIFSPRFILVIQFFILFFTIIFFLSFMTYLQRFLSIIKKLRNMNCSFRINSNNV